MQHSNRGATVRGRCVTERGSDAATTTRPVPNAGVLVTGLNLRSWRRCPKGSRLSPVRSRNRALHAATRHPSSPISFPRFAELIIAQGDKPPRTSSSGTQNVAHSSCCDRELANISPSRRQHTDRKRLFHQNMTAGSRHSTAPAVNLTSLTRK